MSDFNKKLILEDGSEYLGYGFGADKEAVCEIVFNTSMAGYQEIVSDPSYTDQAIVMSYPLIGNYGITDEDFESKLINLGALIVREVNENPSKVCKSEGKLKVSHSFQFRWNIFHVVTQFHSKVSSS